MATSAKIMATPILIRWGAAGWAFFIAENAILSENRSYLISALGGEDEYRAVYGTFSTLAMGSIGYSYYKLQKQPVGANKFSTSIPTPRLAAAWGLTSFGLALASQALPKMQVPVGFSSGGGKLQVRCPFDFAHDRKQRELDNHASIRGLDRITRHPGLWSFGLTAAGVAALQTTNPGLMIWWTGPATVALLGGTHTDSRFRRGLGGHMDPVYESQTSNVPLVALLTGKQGNVGHSLQQLAQETKPLNAAMAVGAAGLWILSRGRIR